MSAPTPRRRTPGLGDRWMAGERLPGVTYAQHDRVVLTVGPQAGTRGTVLLLLAVAPEPAYLVTLDGGAGEVRVRQDALRPTA